MSYDSFLKFVICEGMAKEYAHNDVPGEEG
jgi:hypothetical protein